MISIRDCFLIGLVKFVLPMDSVVEQSKSSVPSRSIENAKPTGVTSFIATVTSFAALLGNSSVPHTSTTKTSHSTLPPDFLHEGSLNPSTTLSRLSAILSSLVESTGELEIPGPTKMTLSTSDVANPSTVASTNGSHNSDSRLHSSDEHIIIFESRLDSKATLSSLQAQV